MTTALDDGDAVAEPRGGAQAWLIWSLSALAFGYAFAHRVAPSVMVSDLMADFAIGGGMLGVLSALYFYPYVVMQVPLGALMDRLGPRALLVGALTLAGLGSLLFGAATTLWPAYLGRVLIGAGSAVGFLASVTLAANWFPTRRFGMITGLTMLVGMASGMLGQAPLALFVEAVGWRATQMWMGGFAFALAALIFLFVRNAPSTDAAPKPVEPWSRVWFSTRDALSRRLVWKAALVAATMSGPMLVIGGLWGTPYLMEAFRMPRPEAAFFASLVLFGWAVGAPLSGWLSDTLNRRKGIVVAGAIGMTACIAGLVIIPPFVPVLVFTFLFGIGLFGSFMIVIFAIVRATVPVALIGAALGVVNGMTVASGAVLQPLVGLSLDMGWTGRLANGSRLYDVMTYHTAFALILGTAIIGMLAAFTLPPDEPA